MKLGEKIFTVQKSLMALILNIFYESFCELLPCRAKLKLFRKTFFMGCNHIWYSNTNCINMVKKK